MIQPIARTHAEATEKAGRIKAAETTLNAARRHNLTENVVYGVVVLTMVTGALMLGKLISVIVRSL